MIPPRIRILRDRWLPAVLVAVTTLIGFGIGIISLMLGWNTIFQNLLYFPIILACVYYTRRGFVLSVAIACGYFVLMALFSHDAVVLEGAFIRVLIFILVAGVITYLSEIRNRTEAALQESEDLFRRLLTRSFDAVIIHVDGRIVMANDVTARLFGTVSPNDLIGKPVMDLSPVRIRDEVSRKTSSLLSSPDETVHLVKMWFVRQDGTEFISEIMATKTRYLGKNAILLVFRDITERERAEENLRISEEKYRGLFEQVGDAIFIADAITRRIIDCNRKAEDLTSRSRAELLEMTADDLHPDDVRAQTIDRFVAFLEGKARSIETEVITKYGKRVPVSINATPAELDGRRCLIGIFRDITWQKEVQKAIAEMTEEVDQFFSTSLDLFCIADTDGYFRRLNPEWENALGWPVAELEGKKLLEYVHPDDMQTTLAVIQDLARQNTVTGFVNRCRHRDGSWHWIEWRSVPRGTRIFAAARDITRRYLDERYNAGLSALKQELLISAPLEEKLKKITDTCVSLFDADFARIWISRPGDLCEQGCIHAGISEGPNVCRDHATCLHLIVSSGRYTHTDGGHRRVPFGAYKIGRVASGEDPFFITNDVTHDPRVHDHAWAASLGLVSFAGFRLLSAEGKPIGVLALFCRQQITPDMTLYLDDLATSASQVVQTATAEDALRESEDRFRRLIHGSFDAVIVHQAGRIVLVNDTAIRMMGAQEPGDILGRPVIDFVHPDYRMTVGERMQEMLASNEGTVPLMEEKFLRRDGSSITVAVMATATQHEGKPAVMVVFRDITEQKRAEEEVFQSRQMLQAVLDTIPQRVFWKDRNSVFLGCNRPLALDAGYQEPADLVGKTDYDYTTSEIAEMYRADDHQVMESGVAKINYEEPQVRPGGDRAWLSTSKIPLRDQSGEIIGVLGTYEDITGRKRMEEALRESEEKYRQLYDSMTDAFASVDMSGRLTLFNESFRQMVGYEPAEITSLTYNDLTPEKWHAKEAEIIEHQVLRRGYSEIYEKEYRRKDGTVFPAEIRTFLMKDTAGNNKGMWALVRDITERKKAEEAIRNEKQFSETIIDSIPGIFYVFDEQGRFIRSNRNHLAVLGYTEHELHQITALDTIAPEDHAIAAENIRAVFSQSSTTMSVKILTKDGRKIPYFLSGVSLAMSGQKYFVGTGIDITEQVRAQEAIRESEEKYRVLFTQMTEGCALHEMIYDGSGNATDYRILDVNPAFESILGLKREEVVGKTGRGAYGVELPPFLDTYALVASTGRPESFEVYFAPMEKHFFISIYSPGPGRFATIFTDITERKLAEELLRENQLQLAAAMDLAQIVNWEFDVVTRIFTFNDRFYALYGTTVDREGGYQMPADVYAREFVHPDDVNMLAQEFQKDIETTDPLFTSQAEHRIIRRDGEVRHIIVRHAVTLDASGMTIKTHGVNQDVTERKRAEEALRQSEELLRLFIEHAPAALVMLDMDLRYIAVSHRWRADYHIGDRDIIGHSHLEIFPELSNEIIAVLRRALAGEVISSNEDRFVRLDGAVQWLAWEVRPWYTSGQNVGGVIIFSEDITERKRAEEALRESEEKYRAIVEDNQDMVYRADMNGIFTMVNPAGARMVGLLSPEDLIGMPVAAHYNNPDDRLAFIEALKKNGMVENYPVTLRSADGRILQVLVNSHFFYNANGVIQGVEGIIHDITELRQIEEALQQSEKKYRDIIENIQDMVYRADMNGIFTMVNPAGVRLFGFASEAEMTGRPVTDVYANPDDRRVFLDALKKTGSVYGYPLLLKCRDGTLIHVLASSHYFHDASGNLLGVEGALHDVTDLRRMEEALHTAQEKFLKAFQEAPDGITISDLDTGEFLEVNDAATKILGYSRDELIGHAAIDLGIWQSKEKRDEFISQLRREGRVEQYEVVERRKSGEIFYCHINADTILIGNRKCFLAVLRDVTEQKNAQDALKKAHDELEERVQERTKALRESEERLRLKLESVLSPETNIGELELANILDIPEIQSLMEDFTHLTGMTTAILDMKGNIIEATGWQDICTKFHRKNEKTAKFCTESDLYLAENLTPGQHIMYKCKNGLWDVATPLYFGTKHAGNIYTGQFFFTDEPVDEKAFLARAEEYGFDKNEYMAALSRVPRFSREQVNILMDYLVRFTLLISRISFFNLQLAQAKNRLELTAEDLRKLTSDLDKRVVERTAELSAAQEAYQRANEKLNLLSSITRHDIKNQLLALQGYIQLSRNPANTGRLGELLDKEQKIAENIDRQITFTRDYEDLGVKSPQWQDVVLLIRDVSTALPMQEIRLEILCPPLEIYADPLLTKVFYNLIDNSLHYGGEKMTVFRVTQEQEGDVLRIICEDDGAGISAADKKHLFTKGFGKHTGLGLFLSREILSITGITITETGEPGRGARFEIIVPRGGFRFTGETSPS